LSENQPVGNSAVARRRGWLDRVEFAVFRAAVGALGALPRRLALRVGATIGDLLYLLDRPHRRVALFNLEIAFPHKTEAERQLILRRSCRNLGRMAGEVSHLWKSEPKSAERYVEIDEPEVWERAVAVGRVRGGLLLTGHFGNWEMLSYCKGLLGIPATLIYRPMRNRLVDEAIVAYRSRAGTRSIAKKSAARGALRVLRRRELLAILGDQNQPRREGVFVDFFGKRASTTPGPARLAMLTGAPVYPALLVRQGESDRHRLVVLPEVEMVDTGDKEADIVANTQRCNLAIEEMVRTYPEQWIWFHKRWRTQGLGEPKVYP